MSQQFLPWRLASASVTGTSHERSGAPCQDNHAFSVIGRRASPVLLVAVSDGAGSAPHSAQGSLAAVEAIKAEAEAWFASGRTIDSVGRPVMDDWFKAARQQIASLAEAEGLSTRDCACTLLVALVTLERSVFAQIGDGAIVARWPDGDWRPVFWPQHGPYVNTTHFITDDNAIEQYAFNDLTEVEPEVAVFTDGLEGLVLDNRARSAHQPFFDRMFPPLRSSGSDGADVKLSNFLASYLVMPAVTAKTDDDLTLVLATRCGPQPPRERAVQPPPLPPAFVEPIAPQDDVPAETDNGPPVH